MIHFFAFFIRRLINDFSNLFQPLLFIAFVWSTMAICVAMLMIQMTIVKFSYFVHLHKLIRNSILYFFLNFQTLNEFNLIMLVVLFVNVSYAFGLIFIVCELCQKITDGFNKMNETLNQFNWQSYPIEVQRLLPIFIIITQQPMDFKVFGSIACCRESFKNVSYNTTSSLECSYGIIYYLVHFRLSTKHSHTLW